MLVGLVSDQKPYTTKNQDKSSINVSVCMCM